MSRLREVRLAPGADLDGFRRAARHLVVEGAAPEAVAFTDGAGSLFGEAATGDAPPLPLPRSAIPVIEEAVRHQDPERYALLYSFVWRILGGERALPEIASDPLVHRLDLMRRGVRRDIHKMHAFVRFREGEEGRFLAWFEPEHHILEAVAPFFRDRFPSFPWSILTPRGSIHWDRQALRFGPPGRREDVPADDPFEAGWRDYYGSTFNPARVNPRAMRAEMPKKYWRNLPEALAIPALIRGAPSRVDGMLTTEPTMPTKRTPQAALDAMHDRDVPATIEALNDQIRAYEPPEGFATRAVLGEGKVGAPLVFVGEQPGDQEEIQGRPFVGPAGQLLTRALEEAGLDRSQAYLTNAVKHFKFEPRGKRRIHQKPTAGEVRHYRPWLLQEIALVRPRLVVALGATAVLGLTGKQIPITRARGPADLGLEPAGFITVHPSYLLRLPDQEAKRMGYERFIEDLAQVRAMLEDPGLMRAAE